MYLVLGLAIRNEIEVDINVVQEAKTIVPVPYLFKDKNEFELEQLLNKSHFQPVEECSGWASPMVPVKNAKSSIRICGDYKVTVNKVAKFDKYHVPKNEDSFATLYGGEGFFKLNLTQPYQQILLHDYIKNFKQLMDKKVFSNQADYNMRYIQQRGVFKEKMKKMLGGILFTIAQMEQFYRSIA